MADEGVSGDYFSSLFVGEEQARQRHYGRESEAYMILDLPRNFFFSRLPVSSI